MEYQDKYDHLIKLLTEDFEIEGKKYNLKNGFEKLFVRENKTAGTRIRKVMQELKKVAQGIRDDVQTYKEKI